MIAENFVDEMIPDWQMQPEDQHRITLKSSIVYKLPGTRAQFEIAIKTIEARKHEFLRALTQPRDWSSRLAVIDAKKTECERQALSARLGANYVDHFIYDTERAVTLELGQVMRECASKGVRMTPHHISQAIHVRPCRSFRTDAARSRFLAGKTSQWMPTVRLDLKLDLEGQREKVENAVAEIKCAMLFCGPVTSFSEEAALIHKRVDENAEATSAALS